MRALALHCRCCTNSMVTRCSAPRAVLAEPRLHARRRHRRRHALVARHARRRAALPAARLVGRCRPLAVPAARALYILALAAGRGWRAAVLGNALRRVPAVLALAARAPLHALHAARRRVLSIVRAAARAKLLSFASTAARALPSTVVFGLGRALALAALPSPHAARRRARRCLAPVLLLCCEPRVAAAVARSAPATRTAARRVAAVARGVSGVVGRRRRHCLLLAGLTRRRILRDGLHAAARGLALARRRVSCRAPVLLRLGGHPLVGLLAAPHPARGRDRRVAARLPAALRRLSSGGRQQGRLLERADGVCADGRLPGHRLNADGAAVIAGAGLRQAMRVRVRVRGRRSLRRIRTQHGSAPLAVRSQRRTLSCDGPPIDTIMIFT